MKKENLFDNIDELITRREHLGVDKEGYGGGYNQALEDLSRDVKEYLKEYVDEIIKVLDKIKNITKNGRKHTPNGGKHTPNGQKPTKTLSIRNGVGVRNGTGRKLKDIPVEYQEAYAKCQEADAKMKKEIKNETMIEYALPDNLPKQDKQIIRNSVENIFSSERQRLAKAIKSKKVNGVYFLETQVEALLKLIEKYEKLKGKDLDEFSLETVKMFYDDGQKAGYKL